MLGIFLSYLLIYKYLVLFLVSFLAALIFPLPASSMLVAAGAFSSQDYFNLKYVLLVALLGNVVGDIVGYFVSYYLGKNFLMRIGLKKIINSEGFIILEKKFVAHAASAIFFSRCLITALGSTVNILAGLSKISFKKFFLFDFSGEVIYVLSLCGLGYIFGIEWKSIYEIIEDFSEIIIIIALIGAMVIFYFWKKRKKI